jgi:hypothetical protein
MNNQDHRYTAIDTDDLNNLSINHPFSFIGVHRCSSVVSKAFSHRYTPINTDKDNEKSINETLSLIPVFPGSSVVLSCAVVSR